MLSKLAANWDDSQGGPSLPTSMSLVNSWHGDAESTTSTQLVWNPIFQQYVSQTVTTPPSTGYYYIPVDEGDLVAVVTSNDINVTGGRFLNNSSYGLGVYSSLSSGSVRVSVFNASALGNYFYYRNPAGNIYLNFNFSNLQSRQTDSTVALKNHGIISIFHLRPDEPFLAGNIAGTNTLTTGVTTNSLAVASRSSTTPTNNYSTPSTGFEFGIISTDMFVQANLFGTSPWAPTSVGQPYYVTDTTTANRPQPANTPSNLTSSGAPTLYANTTNLVTPRTDVAWSWTYSFWNNNYTYMAFRHDTFVVPTAGTTHNMAHAFTWSGSQSSIFETKYFSFNIGV